MTSRSNVEFLAARRLFHYLSMGGSVLLSVSYFPVLYGIMLLMTGEQLLGFLWVHRALLVFHRN